MTRRFCRIRSTVVLAVAVTAVTAPATPASVDRVTPDARDAGRPVLIDRVSPDARDAWSAVPTIDLASPDARDNGRREAPPVVVAAPSAAAADRFDWLDAGIGAAALLLLGGSAAGVRTRRGSIRAA